MVRVCLVLFACALAARAAEIPAETLEGRLVRREGKPPAAVGPRGTVALEGDEHTRKVLSDPRLDGMEIKVRGRFAAPDRFQVDPIHTKAVLVRKDGRYRLVSYWCDICSIRTYSPGPCWCCQRETTLELRDLDLQ